MKKIILLAMLPCVAVILAGCTGEKPSEPATSGGGSTHTHEDGSTHDDHAEEGGHSHGEGPHDGTVADWGGGKYHVEFTVDHDKTEATVYTLGDDGKTAVPVDAGEITLTIKEPSLTTTLVAAPQDGDPEGKSSRFVGKHDGLGTVMEYEGTISGVVDGTPYSGNFKEVAHNH